MKRLGRILLWVFALLGAAGSVALLAAVLCRRPLAEWVLGRVLTGAGIEVRNLSVREVGLHRAELSPVDLVWRGQGLHVDLIRIHRASALTPSLGQVEISGVRLSLDATAFAKLLQDARGPVAQEPPPPLPDFQGLDLAGSVVLGTLVQPFRLHLAPGSRPGLLAGDLALNGEALSGSLRLHYSAPDGAFGTETQGLELSLIPLRRFAEQYGAPLLPGWDLEGRLRVSGSFSLEQGRSVAALKLDLLGLNLGRKEQGLAVEGITGSLQFTDLGRLLTEPAQELRVTSASVGALSAKDIQVRLQVQGGDLVRIEGVELSSFGGRVSVSGFELRPSAPSLNTRLRFTRIDVEELLRFFPVEGTQATGLVDGDVPVRYGKVGLQFGAGWLKMSAGCQATLKLVQPGLLTSGLSPSNLSYPTMKAIEDGLLNLRVKAMNAELFDVSDPTARSALLHVDGEPLDPNVKAPVSIDVNVNGPLAALVNWSLDSRIGLRVTK
jgi:hypothetical protein